MAASGKAGIFKTQEGGGRGYWETDGGTCQEGWRVRERRKNRGDGLREEDGGVWVGGP